MQAPALDTDISRVINTTPGKLIYFLTVALCFFMPFKFGDLTGVPEAASVLPVIPLEWFLNNWGDAFFASATSLLLVAAIIFLWREQQFSRPAIIYCGGFLLIFFLSLAGWINFRGIDYPAAETVHIGGAAAFLLLFAVVCSAAFQSETRTPRTSRRTLPDRQRLQGSTAHFRPYTETDHDHLQRFRLVWLVREAG